MYVCMYVTFIGLQLKVVIISFDQGPVISF